MDFKAGMFLYALAFLLGVVFVQAMTVLPDVLSLAYGFIVVTFVYLCYRTTVFPRFSPALTKHLSFIYYLISLFIIGIVYVSIYASEQLQYRLNEDLTGQDVLLSGVVSNIPVSDSRATRFVFEVDTFEVNNSDASDVQIEVSTPKKIRLSWYSAKDIEAGEKWQLLVRLKPPHGFMNPGGFDYEAWLFQQRIHATGYIRKSDFNKRLLPSDNGSINRIRQSLGKRIDNLASDKVKDKSASASTMALVKALAIGDKSSITTAQWDVLKNTGTSHLMAISGLHIGLAALFVYMLLRWILPEYIMKRVPAQHVAMTGGMAVALLYALVAGFSIPTQRAVIMLFTLSVMMLIRRNHRPLDALGLAIVLVLLIDPLAVLSAGFWFSFSAVAVIFISVVKVESEDVEVNPYWHKVGRVIKQWVRLQLIISLFLLPLSLYMFQQASLVSPLANLLLIPYVSFLVVPVVLLAIVCSFFLPTAANALFELSAMLLDLIWPTLAFLGDQPYSYWVKGDLGVVSLLLASTALLILYYSKNISAKSRRWALRALVLVLLVPLFVNNKSSLNFAELQVAVLDVGQGSAAVVQTKNHTLVFDTGAKFSEKMNAGSSAVVPYLRYLGMQDLDRLIISHGDNDHIGGAQAIVAAYPDVEILGQDLEGIVSENKRGCHSGLAWRWDGVDFEFLSPTVRDEGALQREKRNNRSCVLRVASRYGSVLFTGDIERKVEKELLLGYGESLASDILIVPHHGSKTSSSQAFIDAVNPKYSIISVGYKNRYKLPNSKVLSRYTESNHRLLRTDNSGAITITMDAVPGLRIERYRQKNPGYWYHSLH